jgi:hypothetical protein
MAEGESVIVKLAVAVRIAFWPGFSALTLVSRCTRGWEPATPSVQIGMLGVTVRAMSAAPIRAGGAVAGWSSVSLQEAVATGPALPVPEGHAACPPGREDTPGVGCAAPSPELQLAFGPEAGHCRSPVGSARRSGSSDGTTCLACEAIGVATGTGAASAT